MSFFSKIEARISSSPLVHVVIAAFIGGVTPVLVPVIQGNDLSAGAVRIALYAGVAAVLRVVVLLVPAKGEVPQKPAA